MKKYFLVIACAIAIGVLGSATNSFADAISFKDTNLGWVAVDMFDWNVGTALADNAVPLSADSQNQTGFTLYYQAAMSSLNYGGSTIGGTGLGVDYEITVIAGAGEMGYRATNGSYQEANFLFDSKNPVNYFAIYYDTQINANPLAGTGFNDGILLMSGIAISGNGAFSVDTRVAPQALDQFDAQAPINDYPLIYTLQGNGSSSATIDITEGTVNPSYISPSGINLLLFELAFTTQQVTPFKQQNPSGLICTQMGVANCVPLATMADLGGENVMGDGTFVNGMPSTSTTGANPIVDFVFQADGSNAFAVDAIPEPSTIVLLGLGLVALGGLGLRKKM